MAYQIIIPIPHSWDYMLWSEIFVAPIVEDALERDVDFPDGSDWVYWFDPSRVYPGDTTVSLTFPLTEFPIFHRKGSIIPLDINSEDSIHGDADSIGRITALVAPLQNHTVSIPIRRWKQESIEMSYTWTEEKFVFMSTKSQQNIIVLIQGVKSCPLKVWDIVSEEGMTIGAVKVQSGVFCDLKNKQLFVKPKSSAEGTNLEIYGLETF